MGVTLQQIAEAVGVSRGTVDRALNDRGRIKPEVAEKIKKIAEEMGYQPNRAGRALAMAKQSVRIGVILQSADTPFMKKVLNGIEDAKVEVERMGIEVMVKKLNGIDSVKVMDTMKKMRASGCKGIAMVPVEDEELKKLIHEFVEEGIPVVTFNSDLEDSDRLCFVGQNALQSGKVAAGLMAEILPKGAKVQVISGYPSNQSHRNRSKGFISELNAVRKDVEVLDIQYAYDDSKIAGKITEATDEVFDKQEIKHVVFDFSTTTFMDSSGIGIITRRFRQVYARGGSVGVINVNDRIDRILLMSGIYRIAEKLKQRE